MAAQAAQGSEACGADAADRDACVACDVGVAAAGVVVESVDERARPGGKASVARRTCRLVSVVIATASGVGSRQGWSVSIVATGCSVRWRRMSARYSRRAVVVSHPPSFSGSRMVAACSKRRSQVFCMASAASAEVGR